MSKAIEVLEGAARALGTMGANVLWPARCAGCDGPGHLLCDRCAGALPWVRQRWACPVCGAPHGWLVCTECEGGWETAGCVSAFSLAPPASRLVTVYKDEHERRLAPVLAAAMACAIDEAVAGRPGFCNPSSLDGLVFIPSTSQAYRRRGFDPMEWVARSLSALVGVPVIDALVHRESEDQRRLGREERARNVRGTFSVVADVSASRLLLVDDVVTTGASIREAARALLARGASQVWAASAVRTW